jgi:multisubunit Na+/H+ antiporter MnhE subunit
MPYRIFAFFPYPNWGRAAYIDSMSRSLAKLPISPVKTVLVWAMQWGLWLLFADNAGIREMCIGAIAAGFATLGEMVFACQLHKDYHFRSRDLLQIHWLFWYTITGACEVMQGLGRQLFTKRGADSFVGAVPFNMGGDTPTAAGRRCLAITYTTATPNCIVLGLEPKKKLLLYHQIIKGPIRSLTKNLGARP